MKLRKTVSILLALCMVFSLLSMTTLAAVTDMEVPQEVEQEDSQEILQEEPREMPQEDPQEILQEEPREILQEDLQEVLQEEPHEHSYSAAETLAPSCTEQGYTLYVCECGESY